MSCKISSKDSFKKCVYDIFCQCYNQCVNLTPEFTKTQPICSEILYDKNFSTNVLHSVIKNAIAFFIESNLIIKVYDKFYIKSDINLRLTWENIKSLQSEESKEMFWLFRKLIVDCIVKIALGSLRGKSDIKVYSVGSTNMTSDYDITLYGDSVIKVSIIQNFNKIFKDYFREESSIVFDTNIYGKAYIRFDNKDYQSYFKKEECFQEFYFLKDSTSNDACLAWALTRYFKDLRESFGENIFNQIYSFLKTNIAELEVLETSFKCLLYLNNKDSDIVNYLNLLGVENKFLENYPQDNFIIGLYDYISLINFYGVETYITRGAFMDTVVNSQMCKNPVVDLKSIDYICSIIENTSFFFTHNTKTKYIVRVKETLKKLVSLPGYESLASYINLFEQYLKPLETIVVKDSKYIIDYDLKYCSKIIESGFVDIFQCSKYEMFNLVINLVYSVLRVYSKVDKDSNGRTIFYNNFVIKSNNVFDKNNLKSITSLI